MCGHLCRLLGPIAVIGVHSGNPKAGCDRGARRKRDLLERGQPGVGGVGGVGGGRNGCGCA